MAANNQLTLKEQAVLQFIKDQIRKNGYPPSVREIGEAVGLRSSSSVHKYLVQLEHKGYIRKDPTKPRTVIPIDAIDEELFTESIALPLLGTVAAGVPILAQENIESYYPIPTAMLGLGTHFLLQVQGESMIEAGIFDQDLLIVRQQNDAVNGDIVVAVIEDEATVKRFYRRPGYIELKPENQNMASIISDSVHIAGKVTGLLRRM